MSRFKKWCNQPTTLKRMHGWLTVGWLLLAFPAVLFWKESVPFLVFVSVYANVVGHWSSWEAARVEVKQEEDADVQEVLDAVKGNDGRKTNGSVES